MSTPTEQPTVLWEPTDEQVERATMTRFSRWVADTRGVDVAGDYHALWRWSVDDVEAFWAAIWEFFEVESESGYEQVLGSREMPGAEWFPGATVSYARHIFRGRDDDDGGDPPRVGAARARRVDVGRPARADRRGGGRPALAGGREGRPGRRVHPEHPRGRGGAPGVRVDRRDVVVVLARLRRAQRRRPLRADRAEGAASPSTATATAARTSTASTPSRGSQGEMDSLQKTVVLPYLDASPDLGRLEAR